MHEDKPHSAKRVGERLRWFREVFLEDMTQLAFGESIGASEASVSQWESGKQRLSLPAALTIHEVYGLDPNFLYLNRRDGVPHRIAKALAASGLDSRSS